VGGLCLKTREKRSPMGSDVGVKKVERIGEKPDEKRLGRSDDTRGHSEWWTKVQMRKDREGERDTGRWGWKVA